MDQVGAAVCVDVSGEPDPVGVAVAGVGLLAFDGVGAVAVGQPGVDPLAPAVDQVGLLVAVDVDRETDLRRTSLLSQLTGLRASVVDIGYAVGVGVGAALGVGRSGLVWAAVGGVGGAVAVAVGVDSRLDCAHANESGRLGAGAENVCVDVCDGVVPHRLVVEWIAPIRVDYVEPAAAKIRNNDRRVLSAGRSGSPLDDVALRRLTLADFRAARTNERSRVVIGPITGVSTARQHDDAVGKLLALAGLRLACVTACVPAPLAHVPQSDISHRRVGEGANGHSGRPGGEQRGDCE